MKSNAHDQGTTRSRAPSIPPKSRIPPSFVQPGSITQQATTATRGPRQSRIIEPELPMCCKGTTKSQNETKNIRNCIDQLNSLLALWVFQDKDQSSYTRNLYPVLLILARICPGGQKELPNLHNAIKASSSESIKRYNCLRLDSQLWTRDSTKILIYDRCLFNRCDFQKTSRHIQLNWKSKSIKHTMYTSEKGVSFQITLDYRIQEKPKENWFRLGHQVHKSERTITIKVEVYYSQERYKGRTLKSVG